MRFSVYLKEQNPEIEHTAHECSRHWASALCAMSAARQIGQNAIQLVTGETWREVKARLKGQSLKQSAYDQQFDGGALLPPLDRYTAYTYPLPYNILRWYERSSAISYKEVAECQSGGCNKGNIPQPFGLQGN